MSSFIKIRPSKTFKMQIFVFLALHSLARSLHSGNPLQRNLEKVEKLKKKKSLTQNCLKLLHQLFTGHAVSKGTSIDVKW